MCSELLRIPIVWHGVPVFGFGIVLVIWLGLAAVALVSTARQADWPTALKAHLPTVLVVAAIIAVGVPRFLPGGVPLRSYGLLVLTGILVGSAISIWRGMQSGLELDDLLALALWIIPLGAVGGRLFYVIEYWNQRIRQPTALGTLKNALAFTEGGLVVYGAFLGAMAGFLLFVKRRKLPGLALADLIAPGMLTALAFGRIGCLMNGCCYGGESAAPWAITFPRENAPRSLSAPYAEQASEGRFYGMRIGAYPGDAGRVLVQQVDPGSPAAAAGLRVGDAITGISLNAMTGLDGTQYPSLSATVAEVSEAHPLEFSVFDKQTKKEERLRFASPEGAAHWLLLTALDEGRSVEITTAAGLRTLPAISAPPRSLPVHPAQIYSSIDAALLAWLLWSYYPYRRRDGEVLALMMMLHPISRFLLEAIRVDESPVWGTGLSISQNLSVGFFVLGVGLWLFLRRKPLGRLAFPLDVAAHGEPAPAPIR